METSPIEVQKALKGMDYPAKKQDLIEKAKQNGAPQEVMDVLQNLPEKEFENAVDVSKEFKGEGGEGGSRGGSSRGGQESSSRGGQESSSRGGSRSSQGGQEEGISHRGAGSPPIETQKALKGMDYPAGKQEILEKAKSNNATQEIMQILQDIPDREYESAVDVSKEFKGETGHVEEMPSRGGSNRGGQEEGEGISHRGAGSPPIETQKALKGMDYPAGKQEILEKAKSNNAPQEVMQILQDIPDREYESAADVSKEFKGETGHIEEERGGRGGNRGGNKGGR